MAPPPTTSTPQTRSPFPQGITLLAASSTGVGGLASLLGWATGTGWLTGGFPFARAMNPGGSAALVLLSVAVLLTSSDRRGARAASTASAAGAAVLGALSLSATFGGPDASIDTWFVGNAGTGGAMPQMAPQVAFVAALLALALWLRWWRPRLFRELMVLCVISAMVAAIVLIGYLYGADVLYQPFGAQAAAPFAAVGLHLLAIAIAASATPASTWQALTAATPGAVLLRRVLPLSLIVLVASGHLAVLGFRHGWVTSEGEAAAIVVVSGLVVMLLLVRTGLQLNRSFLEVADARAQVNASHERLYRQALELNDDVIQRLATAWLAHNLGQYSQAHQSIREATSHAQRISSELLHAQPLPLGPGRLVRRPVESGDGP